MFESIEEQGNYDENFYQELQALEEKHLKKASPQTTSGLIAMYSDLVQYFDNISESVSTYFQIKLKKLINISAPRQEMQQRKKKAESIISENKIMKEMARDGPVEELTMKQIGTIDAYQRKIVNIIDQQKEELQMRSKKRNLRKCLTKSASCILSVDSTFDSPDKSEKPIQKMDTLHLFESLIDSQN